MLGYDRGKDMNDHEPSLGDLLWDILVLFPAIGSLCVCLGLFGQTGLPAIMIARLSASLSLTNCLIPLLAIGLGILGLMLLFWGYPLCHNT